MTDIPTNFMNDDDIFQDLFKVLKPNALLELASMSREDLPQCHHSLGQYIRNTYHLWDPAHPHTVTEEPEMKDGIITDPRFPDQVSQRLIERVWAAMQ